MTRKFIASLGAGVLFVTGLAFGGETIDCGGTSVGEWDTGAESYTTRFVYTSSDDAEKGSKQGLDDHLTKSSGAGCEDCETEDACYSYASVVPGSVTNTTQMNPTTGLWSGTSSIAEGKYRVKCSDC